MKLLDRSTIGWRCLSAIRPGRTLLRRGISRLLKENGQPDQAKEMCDRVYQSGNYYKALNIISEYVETELSEKTHTKSKNEKERGDAR